MRLRLALLAAAACAALTLSATPAHAASCGTLRYGSLGPCVTTVQQQLSAAGYHPASLVTGRFYGITRDTVRAFQADHHLRADGIVGPLTRAALATATPARLPKSCRVGLVLCHDYDSGRTMLASNGQVQVTMPGYTAPVWPAPASGKVRGVTVIRDSNPGVEVWFRLDGGAVTAIGGSAITAWLVGAVPVGTRMVVA